MFVSLKNRQNVYHSKEAISAVKTRGVESHCPLFSGQSRWAKRPQTGKLCLSWLGPTTNSLLVIQFQIKWKKKKKKKKRKRSCLEKHVDFWSVIKTELSIYCPTQQGSSLCYDQHTERVALVVSSSTLTGVDKFTHAGHQWLVLIMMIQSIHIKKKKNQKPTWLRNT